MKHLLFFLVFFLSACGTTATQAVDAVVSSPTGPAQPSPTSPPATLEPARIPLGNSPLQRYTHTPSQQFSIAYPGDWQYFEQADGVVFIDPTNQARYSVFFGGADTDLDAFVRQFVESNFGGEKGFEILGQTEKSIQFKGRDETLGPVMNELSFAQHNDLVYFVLVTVVEGQWAAAAETMRGLAGSLEFHQAATPTPADPDAPPLWVLYGHPEERFGFLYPSNWDLLEAEHSASARWPAHQFSFSVQVEDAPEAAQNPDFAKTFAQEEVDKLAGQFASFEALPVTPYQTGQGDGYTADYLYTDETGLPIAGSIIVTVVEDKLYHISISAPAPVYEEALAWFNPMLQSFKLLADD